MIGLIILFWAGKTFYQLAHEFDKNRWAFAILGVVTYYGGTILAGVVIGVLFELNSPGYINETNEKWVGYLTIPFGMLTCWLTYLFLKKRWSTPNDIDSGTTLDADLTKYNKDER